MQCLEAVKKFACKVCLKMWNLDYESMLQMLGLPCLSVRRKYLKPTTTYYIVSHMYYPSSIFVQSALPYIQLHQHIQLYHTFAHTNYIYHNYANKTQDPI